MSVRKAPVRIEGHTFGPDGRCAAGGCDAEIGETFEDRDMNRWGGGREASNASRCLGVKG